MLKEHLNQILKEQDWETLKDRVTQNNGWVRNLMNRIYIKDGLMFWRAVEGLGRAAFELEKEESGYSAELVRRYFWSLNEESGGTAWNASEAIGSIMYYNPKECGHFIWMFSGLLEDESLQQGVLWGLAHLAMKTPEIVYPLAERVLPFLEAKDPTLRGLAVWVYSLIRDYDRENLWIIPNRLKEQLAQDQSNMNLYHNGELKTYRVLELLNPEVVFYWSEGIDKAGYSWQVTVANTKKGLCWVGLGAPEKEEEKLRTKTKRWSPQSVLLRRRAPNEKVLTELEEYFSGNRKEFGIPLDSIGTPFQRCVWEELRRIPYGETRTYSDIAREIGNPKGQRAVGLANNKNPIGVVVPCHRVIGKNGDLVGYAEGVDLKERLLKLEATSTAEAAHQLSK